MRGVTPALSARWRPLHRHLVESGKPTASPRRSPETQFKTHGTCSISVARSRMAPRAGVTQASPINGLDCQTGLSARLEHKSLFRELANWPREATTLPK